MIEIPIQMRFADVDMLRHVNNVNLQHYFDLGKTHYVSDVLGLNEPWLGKGLIIVSINTSYMSQVRWDSNIVVRTDVEKIGNKSITMIQQLINIDTNQVQCECRTVLCAFDFSTQLSITIPQQWRDKIMATSTLEP